MQFLKFSFLSLAYILLGCQKDETETFTSFSNSTFSNSKISYLALGDSYTIGTAVKPEERWANQLAKKINYQGKTTENPEIIAQAGMTTADLISAINFAKPTKNFDLVSLLIGVNNQFRGQTTDKFQKEFVELLEIATQISNKKNNGVFVLSIPDWGQTPYAAFSDRNKISREIDAFNSIAKKECELRNIAFIDVTTLSRQALNDKTLVANDELHYSGKMYQQWSDKVLPTVEQLLKN